MCSDCKTETDLTIVNRLNSFGTPRILLKIENGEPDSKRRSFR